MGKLASVTIGLVALTSCGSTTSNKTDQLTVSEIINRCDKQFCRVFNSTQVGSENVVAAQITIFVPTDNAFSAYLTERRATLENFLGTPEGEALVKSHTALELVPFPVPQKGVTLQALDGRRLKVEAVNKTGTQYTIAGVFVLPSVNEGGTVVTNGNVLDIEGIIR